MSREILISYGFYPSLKSHKRYLVECGGRGSGKSEFACRKLYIRAKQEGHHRILVLRKIRRTCKNTVVQVWLCFLNSIGETYEYNRTDQEIRFRARDGSWCVVIFAGLDEKEKIKSIKGITAVWVEEVTDFTEDDFLEIDLAFREPGPIYHQIILTFNPVEILAPWLKRRFFDKLDPQAFVHNSTIMDNPVAEMRKRYLKQLDEIRDAVKKDIYRYGIWRVSTGRVYDWEVDPDFDPSGKFDDIFYGCDFGYTINEAAVARIYMRGMTFWAEQVIYEKGLTNQDLGERMRAEGVKDDDASYWDAAEPKSIEELCRMGLNALPGPKGADSVRKGIDLLKSLDIRVVPGSPAILKERATYDYRKDKYGEPLPVPEPFNNHMMDAIRYGITGHLALSSETPFIGVGRPAEED